MLEIASVHRDDHARLIAGPDIDGMAAALAAERKSQKLCNTNQIPWLLLQQFRSHTVISIGLIKMSSAGMGKPSSVKVST